MSQFFNVTPGPSACPFRCVRGYWSLKHKARRPKPAHLARLMNFKNTQILCSGYFFERYISYIILIYLWRNKQKKKTWNSSLKLRPMTPAENYRKQKKMMINHPRREVGPSMSTGKSSE